MWFHILFPPSFDFPCIFLYSTHSVLVYKKSSYPLRNGALTPASTLTGLQTLLRLFVKAFTTKGLLRSMFHDVPLAYQAGTLNTGAINYPVPIPHMQVQSNTFVLHKDRFILRSPQCHSNSIATTQSHAPSVVKIIVHLFHGRALPNILLVPRSVLWNFICKTIETT